MKYIYYTRSGKKIRASEKQLVRWTMFSKGDNEKRRKYKKKLLDKLFGLISVTPNSKLIFAQRLEKKGIVIDELIKLKMKEEPIRIVETIEELEKERKEEGIEVEGIVSSAVEYDNSSSSGGRSYNNFYCEMRFRVTYTNKNTYDEQDLLNYVEDLMRETIGMEFRAGLGESLKIHNKGISNIKDIEKPTSSLFEGQLFYGHSGLGNAKMSKWDKEFYFPLPKSIGD